MLLTVEDVNDNAPRFTRLYSLNVTENAPVGTRLVAIETVDGDANANVSYSMAEEGGDFSIHPATGVVSVARPLDREVRDEYALRVQATDGAWKLDTVITGEAAMKPNIKALSQIITIRMNCLLNKTGVMDST